MSAREEILARLGRATPLAPGVTAAAGQLPATDPAARIALFATRLRAASASFAQVDGIEAVPDAVADYLQAQGLPLRIRVGDSPAAAALRASPRLACSGESLERDGATLVTGCLAAIAGEGVVALASGPAHPAESAFLAATHVITVSAARLLDSLDDLWPLLREDAPPRMLNLVLGPSRTADLGVPSRLGAHGPLRVHVVLVA